MVQAITSTSEFQTATSSGITIVDFHAVWCGPCKMISPKFEEFSAKYTKAKFVKVDVDEVPDVAQTCEVRAMPTFLIFVDGKKVAEVVGADPRKLEAEIQKYAA